MSELIQFIRFAPELHRYAGRIVLCAPAPLVPLLASAPGIDQVIAIGDTPARLRRAFAVDRPDPAPGRDRRHHSQRHSLSCRRCRAHDGVRPRPRRPWIQDRACLERRPAGPGAQRSRAAPRHSQSALLRARRRCVRDRGQPLCRARHRSFLLPARLCRCRRGGLAARSGDFGRRPDRASGGSARPPRLGDAAAFRALALGDRSHRHAVVSLAAALPAKGQGLERDRARDRRRIGDLRRIGKPGAARAREFSRSARPRTSIRRGYPSMRPISKARG